MGRRNKKPPPRVYHDGLIPATHDTYQSYPEVVGDDYDQVKHEKSYPELAPPQDDPESQPQQHHQHHQHHQHQQDPPEDQHQHPQHAHHPSTILTPPTAHGPNSAHHHSNLSPLSGSQPPHHQQQPPPPSALIHPLAGLPRPSGVHSLRQAWSDPGDPEDPHGVLLDADRVPLWKRPVFWVVLVAGAVIVVLAGILGGVASGRVGTALGGAGGRGGGEGSSGSMPPVANPTCPGSGNRNYTTSAASVTMPKTFRIQCDANYPGGDGTLGRRTGSIDGIAGCLDACARESGCVAAVFRPGDAAECWLKEFVGVVQAGGKAQGMVSGVLWQ